MKLTFIGEFDKSIFPRIPFMFLQVGLVVREPRVNQHGEIQNSVVDIFFQAENNISFFSFWHQN